jgi:hypothetical protein
MSAYLYNEFNKLVEIINNCDFITFSFVIYRVNGKIVKREAKNGHFFLQENNEINAFYN